MEGEVNKLDEQFVPYKLALKLKELGFDERCIATYRKDACKGNPFKYNLDYHTKVQLDRNLCPKNSEYVNDWVSAPLWQQAFDFFEEKYGLYSDIKCCNTKIIIGSFQVNISKMNERKYYFYGFEDKKDAKLSCLKKLIKLTKNNDECKEKKLI